MKKQFIIMLVLMAAAIVPAEAQNVQNSRYYDARTGRLNYGSGPVYHRSSPGYGLRRYGFYDNYFGIRVGPTFSSVLSDNENLAGKSVKTGLNVGVVGGFRVTHTAPLYFELGLGYVEKGGNSKHNGKKFSYSLDYLEVPLTLKYVANIDRDISIQPFLGGYVSVGVGGKIKDYQNREAYSSFDSSLDHFKRGDAGLRMGCGIGMNMFYAELGYDLGLANIGNDNFDDTNNSALSLTVGMNF